MNSAKSTTKLFQMKTVQNTVLKMNGIKLEFQHVKFHLLSQRILKIYCRSHVVVFWKSIVEKWNVTLVGWFSLDFVVSRTRRTILDIKFT